ncbi:MULTISPECIES: ABC transporter ATP-binding protein [unclassified Azospirillum]|uniref:ABC transporter ATP-binding protein n=1 Tax=unclassified Azospirillum TaxID=2630922 RepID=UPI000B6B1406|nr:MULTISPECIES: ABC transporter ATP-binding protein [unclassified Azospirillum]SNT23348.1 NitT/TauT family transport system ATP-binding protein [Azospirillum sp. RU38E]SNT34225.1 NitT/TauT family transport system ATP-binding protein [Azospirillum sp. RU37A]
MNLAPAGAMFLVDDIHYRYPGGQEVFRGLGLRARPGEFIAVLGPSGCGKTTLMNLLSGFLAPQTGSVTVNGQPVHPEMAALGYVFQSPHLFPWLSVLDNVRFGLRMAGQMDDAAQRSRALEFLTLVGLRDAVHKLPHELSGGMQQRVALARALVLEPKLLLLDEPFAALDAITRASMNEELLRLWARLGQTVVFITHDIEEAVFLADRVVVLDVAPAGIHSELTIDLPRPRCLRETRRLSAFGDYTDTLMARISTIVATASGPSPTAAQRISA